MKKILFIIGFLGAILSANAQIGQQPTTFNYGIRLPNATNEVATDSIPVIDGDGVIQGYITKPQLTGNFVHKDSVQYHVGVSNTDPGKEFAPIVGIDVSGNPYWKTNGYQVTNTAASNSLPARNGSGQIEVNAASDPDQAVNLGQMQDSIGLKMEEPVNYSFLKRLRNNTPLSHKYIVRRVDRIEIVYVYGVNSIVYDFRFGTDGYLWFFQLTMQGVDSDGISDDNVLSSITGFVQEYAVRYRKAGTSDPTLWSPYHGSNSVTTQPDSFMMHIDGLEYDYSSIPLDDPWLFDEINIEQNLTAKYDPGDMGQIKIKIIHFFDEKQLHFQNDYEVIEDIEVLRWFGSRLSIRGAESIKLDNGFERNAIGDNVQSQGSEPIYSALMESANVWGANELLNFRANTSYGKEFLRDNNRWNIWDRSSGEMTLYWQLSTFMTDDSDLATIPSGENLRSENNIFYVPKTYTDNPITLDIQQSPGIIRELSPYVQSGGYLTEGVTRVDLTDSESFAHNTGFFKVTSGANSPYPNAGTGLRLRYGGTRAVEFFGAVSGGEDNFWMRTVTTDNTWGSPLQIASRPWVNSQGFLTSPSTLQEVLDAGNVSTTGLNIADPADATDQIQLLAGDDPALRYRKGDDYYSQSVVSGEFRMTTPIASGVSTSSPKLTLFTADNRDPEGDPNAHVATFSGRVKAEPAQDADDVITGGNAGFGISWNDTTNEFDWGETSTLGSNDYHYVNVPEGNYFGLGDINDLTSPSIYVRRDNPGGVNAATLRASLSGTNQAIINTQVSSGGDPSSEIKVINGAASKGLFVSELVSGIIITDEIDNAGMVYDADYSANYTDRSIPDVAYVDKPKRGTIGAAVPAVLAHLTSDQSIPNSTHTNIDWDTIEYDQFNIWNGTTGFVVPSWATHAKVTVKIEFAANSTGTDRSSWLQLNGSEVIGMGYNSILPHNGRNVINYTSGVFPVTDGDVITNTVNQDSGGALNLLTGTANQRCFIQIELFESF